MAYDFTELDLAVAGSPGASIDADLLTEIKTNFQQSALIQKGDGTDAFNGTTGTAVTITDVGSTDYTVTASANQATGGNLGDVWVIKNSGTQFTVYCSGSFAGTFDWVVVEW